MYFRHSLLSPLGKKIWPFIWKKKLEFPSPNNALCNVWMKVVQWFWRRIKFRQCLLTISVSSPIKKAGSFIWRNLNSVHPRMISANFSLKLAEWFWIRRWKCEKFIDCLFVHIYELNPLFPLCPWNTGINQVQRF